MKLLSVKKRKIAVLFTSGLGDTLLYTPLLKELKQKHFNITCIFYSKNKNDCLFDEELADKKITINSRGSLLLYALIRPNFFSNIYLNHLAQGNILNIAAKWCSKRTTKTINTKTKNEVLKRNKPVISFYTDAEQNLNLLYSKLNSPIKKIESFHLPKPVLNKKTSQLLPVSNLKMYFIIQVSTGNNQTPFKNWPLKNWLTLVEKLCRTYPDFEFVVAGDNTETGFIKYFKAIDCLNCRIIIGETSVEEIFNITAGSSGYIGLDSGIMHIAVALKKKTLTIFGASNENLYGYEFLDPVNHKVLKSEIVCRPCSSWKNANTSRVTNPLLCPDFACLTSIEPYFVFNEIVKHFNM